MKVHSVGRSTRSGVPSRFFAVSEPWEHDTESTKAWRRAREVRFMTIPDLSMHPLDEPCCLCDGVGDVEGPYGMEACPLCEARRRLRRWLLEGAVSLCDVSIHDGAVSLASGGQLSVAPDGDAPPGE